MGGFISAHVQRSPTLSYAVQYPHRTAQLTSNAQISAHVQRTIHARLRSPISPPHSSAHVLHTPPKQGRLVPALLGRFYLSSRPTLSDAQSDALQRTIQRSPTLSPTLSDAQSDALQRSVRLSRAALAATHYAASIARPPHKSRDARFAAATLVAHRTAQLTSHTQISAHIQHTIHARLRSPISPPHSSAHVPHTNLSSHPSHNPRFQLRIIRTSLAMSSLGTSK